MNNNTIFGKSERPSSLTKAERKTCVKQQLLSLLGFCPK